MQSTMSGWRAAADPDDLREYDRFGPWIDTVTEAIDMPRRFRPWWPELSAAPHLVKVPRSYDRSQIRPGMDLYEMVIAALPDRLCILRAMPHEVVRRDVARDEVVASVRHTNLLYGLWSLLLADGSRVDMEFNTVSARTIAGVDDYLLSGPDSGVEWSQPPMQPKNHFFGSTIMSLRAEGLNTRPVHIEEPGRLCRTARGRVRVSTGHMVLASRDDLVIVNRHVETLSLFRRANYASDVIRVPFRLMSTYEIMETPQTTPPGFGQLVVTCDRQVIAQPCLAPLDDVARLLDAHGVPRCDPRPATEG